MRTALRLNMRNLLLLGGIALGAWVFVVMGTARAQTGDMSLTDTPAPASQGGGLDMDVNPNAPLAKAPAVRATLRDNVQDTVSSGGGDSGQHLTPTMASVPSQGEQMPSAVAGQPGVSEPISLDHPQVVDTATFASDGTTVALYGIEGVKGEMAEGLQSYLVAHGNRMTCQAQTDIDFVCLQPDGTDVAEVALINGAARAKPDAPAPYRDQEAAAQKDRRGIWASLPPPPVEVKHPTAADTATLVADGKTYVLDGLQGLRSPYADQMQGYIAQHGDSLTCNPQGLPGHYVCLLDDGTDIAKVALVNGAARVGEDAPDAYRVQQAEALNNHRGFWLNQPQEVITATSTMVGPPPTVVGPPPCCAFVPGDDGADGIAYVAGAPTAVIEGETVFLTYGGYAGWGYYDHWHHWRDAPGRYRAHLEHYHPYGQGLRGYGHEGVMRREAGFRPGMGAPGFHPGVGAPGMMHAGAPGGGFIHPAPSMGGFHPGGAAFAPHAAPAFHASAGGGGGGRKH